MVVLSGDTSCEVVTSSYCQPFEELVSDQEEADTKVILHALNSLAALEGNVCIRSPSGDTDIFVVALGIITERSRVKFDHGNGSNRKKIWLDEIEMPVDKRQALIGFHAMTGNDYVSAFFRKGKAMCWKAMIKEDRFVEAFTRLGEDWELSDEIVTILEMYVCRLYGSKKNTVNAVRFHIFECKQKKGVMVDLSILPPCISTLRLHLERANYVARLWKLAGTAMVHPPMPVGSGWDMDGEVVWIENTFPEEISSIFLALEDSDNESDEMYSDSEDYGEDARESEIDADEYDDEI